MINYQVEDSPFFTSNKSYSEKITAQLSTLDVETNGYCNSFGYNIEALIVRNQLTYYLVFHKHQSTRNGVIIPENAVNYSGINATVTGLSKDLSIDFGKSAFKRIFARKKIKNLIPSPGYLTLSFAPDKLIIEELLSFIQANSVLKLRLHDGNFTIKLNSETDDPIDLLDKIEKMTSTWNILVE